ncbi:hypothetical protein BC343_27510 [Mucilaginibacter pedocola]|uniref:MalT-like TPR region domain-containing protein n=2 Tax=Mucilaginibacter pedocola TaxID=1792845 RepID=A0A1S9PG60_9SPHI|nr:hypothetical protein BC343_27510 [Mucilaginibacter pedocola]
MESRAVSLIYARYLGSNAFDGKLPALTDTLAKYQIEHGEMYVSLAGALVNRRESHYNEARQLLLKGIEHATKADNLFFLYYFHLNLAYVETDTGNSLDAILHYRETRRLAGMMNKPQLQVITDIGLSDIYMHLQLYEQALKYLDEVDAYSKSNKADTRSPAFVAVNKAEIFFKLGNKDSLDIYLGKFNTLYKRNFDEQNALTRLKYFSLILHNRPQQAVPIIKGLLATRGEYYKNNDKFYLAQCYYRLGKLDSATNLLGAMVANPKLETSELRINSYKLLSQILEDGDDYAAANKYNRMAAEESEASRKKMGQIVDVVSQIRIDRVEEINAARDEIYSKQRTILIFAIITACLGLVAGGLFYYSIRQKRRYEKLLYQTKTQELAFIHSHEVRRHLANILGLCVLVDEVNPSGEELKKYYAYFNESAQEMDKALKSIEKKLTE